MNDSRKWLPPVATLTAVFFVFYGPICKPGMDASSLGHREGV